MAKVFISYSRLDIEFAKRLVQDLEKNKHDVWIDSDDLPPTVNWWQKIEKAVEDADLVLCLISPDYVVSVNCGREIDHATLNGKRLIPLVVREVPDQDAPAKLNHLNYIFFSRQDDFETAFGRLIEAIRTDYEWVETQSRLQVRALEWARKNKDISFLLRGKDLQEAELQLATNSSKDPHPTDLQREYIFAGRKATDKQRRITAGISLAGIVTLAILAIFGFYQAGQATNNAATAQANLVVAQTAQVDADNSAATAVANEQEAIRQATISRAGELAALALSEKESRFDRAILFGIEGSKAVRNPNTEGALLTLANSHAGLEMYLWGHTSDVKSVTFSPDGKIMVTSGNGDKTIIIWDVSDPTNPFLLAGLRKDDQEVADSSAFSQDGKLLALGSRTTISLWNLNDPSYPIKIQQFERPEHLRSNIIISPDGKYLVSGDVDGNIIVWDIRNPNPISKVSALIPMETDNGIPINTEVMSLAFSPDGKQLASETYGGKIGTDLSLWDFSNPASPSRLAAWGEGFANSVVFSPTGKLLATASGDDIILWDLTHPRSPSRLVALSGHRNFIRSLAFSPDGNFLASGGDGNSVILWDVSQPGNTAQLATLTGHSTLIISVAFSLDGRHLASGDANGAVIMWDISNLITASQFAKLLDHQDVVNSVAFSYDSKLMVSSGDDDLFLWDITDPTNPTLLAPLGTSLWKNAFFSPDGKLLSAGDFLWDISNPKAPSEIAKFGIILSNASDLYDPNYVSDSFAFSPNGKLLASANYSTVRLWNVSRPSVPSLHSSLDASLPSSAAFNPDGNLLVVGDILNITVWDISNSDKPSQLAKLEGEGTDQVAFSPDGKLLASGGSENDVILWSMLDPENPERLSLLEGHNNSVNSLAFSPDGKQLASASSDATIILWDISDPKTPSRLATLTGHTDEVLSIAFSPDGKQLASGGRDKTIILWDVDLESLINKLCHLAGRNFTRAEWTRYFPNEEYRKTCDQWTLEPEEATIFAP